MRLREKSLVRGCICEQTLANVIGISGTLNDITERKRREQHLSAEHSTARVLAEYSTLSVATPKILEAISESLGWDVGELWRVDASANVLRRSDRSYASR
jgi:hypothetical protein